MSLKDYRFKALAKVQDFKIKAASSLCLLGRELTAYDEGGVDYLYDIDLLLEEVDQLIFNATGIREWLCRLDGYRDCMADLMREKGQP